MGIPEPEQADPAEARPTGVVGNIPGVGEAVLLAKVMERMPTGPSAERSPLSTEEMQWIVRRARLLLSTLYAHLASKRVLYSIDPVQSLSNLYDEVGDRDGLDAMPETEFHERMTAIFVSLRDRHTNYYLPRPYRGTIAFLPFLIEAATDDRKTTYYVTKVAAGLPLPDGFPLPAGLHDHGPVVVTHWNGVPIERAVARSGEQSAGANRSARMARGLDRMTFRWLGLSTGPDEAWVDLTFDLAGQSRTVQFKWYAVRRDAAYPNDAREGNFSMALGGDPEGEWIRLVRQGLFAPEAGDGAFAHKTITVGGEKYGYLRIFTFDCVDPRAFLSSVREILENTPQRGLIIDLRGNPGGNMLVAEALLRMFASKEVQGQGLQFVNTFEARALAERIGGGQEMTRFLREARSTAAPFISSTPMSWPALARYADADEPVYAGRVAVIIDANCFSAAEAFAAGMQDHDLADVIIGTHPQTGGGGGNVWPDDLIQRRWKGYRLKPPLAHGASFDIAVRRTTRAGPRAGVALEDMGVVMVDLNVKPITKLDLIDKNRHLLTEVVDKLEHAPAEDR